MTKPINKSLAPALTLAALLSSGIVHADALLPGDPAKGKVAHDKQCISCHVDMAGGDGSKVYTRKDRKVKSIEGLMGQVKGCNQQVNAKFSKEDVDNVINYLNKTYYKF